MEGLGRWCPEAYVVALPFPGDDVTLFIARRFASTIGCVQPEPLRDCASVGLHWSFTH